MNPTLASRLYPICALLLFGPQEVEPSWRSGPPLHYARSAHAVVSDGEAIFAVAGTGSNEDPAEEALPVLVIERFDGEAWSFETELPGEGLNAPAVALLGQRLFVIGGFDLLTNVPTDEVSVYDRESQEWSQAAPLPAPRGGHAAVVLDGRIHVLGGGNSQRTLDLHDEYDPATDRWTKRAPLPRPEGSPAAVAFESELWAIGGRSGTSDYGAVDRWDASADRWSSGPPIGPRGTAGAVVYRGTIWVFGGEVQALGVCLDEVLCLDRASQSWKLATRLPTARNYARAALFHDEVCVVGGSLVAGSSHAAAGSRLVEFLMLPAAQAGHESRK